MPFIVIGVILLIVSVVFLRKAIAWQNKELIVGINALIVAAVVMILFFGIFYNVLVP